MSGDIMDDWFGFDPPPPVPEVETPARPAPTRRTKTSNVVTGVDQTRKYTSTGTSTTGRTERSSLVDIEDDDDNLGVGLNV